METQYVLHIYKAFSGQFSGKIYQESNEIGGIAGCKSELEVLETIEEMYNLYVDFVVDGNSGASLTKLISDQKQKNME